MADSGLSTNKLRLLLLGMLLLVPIIALVFLQIRRPEIEGEALRNLQAIARLKSEQVEGWLQERQADASAQAGYTGLQEQYRKLVLGTAGVDDIRHVADGLQVLLEGNDHASVLLLDRHGALLLARGAQQELPAALSELAQQAIATHKAQRSGMLRDASGLGYLDWLVPVPSAPAPGVLVLRVRVDDSLFPLLQAWPTASASAEILLLRREGDSMVCLNAPRHGPARALSLKLDADHAGMPGALAVQASAPGTASGRDYRGAEVLAAYRPVAGTDWRMVAKVDRSEVLAPLWQSLAWVGVVALVAVAALMLHLLLQRRPQPLLQPRLRHHISGCRLASYMTAHPPHHRPPLL